MVVDIYSTEKKYKTIYIDPPLQEKGGGKIKRGADRHYNLMSIKEIEALPVSNLVDESGCHLLYIWVTNNFLQENKQTGGIVGVMKYDSDF